MSSRSRFVIYFERWIAKVVDIPSEPFFQSADYYLGLKGKSHSYSCWKLISVIIFRNEVKVVKSHSKCLMKWKIIWIYFYIILKFWELKSLNLPLGVIGRLTHFMPANCPQLFLKMWFNLTQVEYVSIQNLF